MIIFRYLTKEVYATLLAVTTVLLLIFISNQFINYLSRAASGGIPIRTVMQLMSLQVPLLLGYLLPLGLFLGILLAYGRLYVDNEMTVMAACGVSKQQLLGMTLALSIFVFILVSILMLWVEPKLAWYRDHIFAEAAAASPIETVLPGRFQTLGEGKWVVYVGGISRDRTELNDVFVAKLPNTDNIQNDPTQPWTVVAAQGGHEWIDPKSGDQFMVLTNGYRYLGVPGQKDFQIVQYGQYGVRIQTGKLHIEEDAQFMSTRELWKKRKTDPEAAAQLQWRLTMPISAFILAILAVPLSQVQPRRGRYAKLLPAILIYIVYADLIFVGEAAIERGKLSPAPGLWLIHSAILLLAIILLGFYFGWWQRFNKRNR